MGFQVASFLGGVIFGDQVIKEFKKGLGIKYKVKKSMP
jgi:hypothetical protein